MRKLMKNKTAGITLIALVVTIIVLLILAGISIQMLTGDNGILTRAGEAQKSTDKFGALEIIQLCTLASYDKTGMINEEDLENELNKEGATIKSKKSNKWYVEYKGYDFEIDLSKRTVVLKEEGNPPEASIEELLRQYFSTDGWAVADPIYNSWRFAEVESVPEIDPNKLEFIWYETIWNDDHSTGHIDDFNELNTARIVMYENKWYLIQNLNEEISVKELNINLNEFGEYTISELNIRALITPGYGGYWYFSDNGDGRNYRYMFYEGPATLDGVTYESGYYWCEWDMDYWDYFTSEGQFIKERYVGDY